jgi:nucleotide-binding universal stress UspA family protein
MFKHILIPTDGSEFSEKVVKDGMALAKAINAKITAVHAYPSFINISYGEFGSIDGEVQEQLLESAKTEGNKYLDRLQAAAKSADVIFDRVLLENDDAWKGILDAAQKKGCDLILMAAHGRRGLSALVLGSETNKVLTHSKIPVLVYR